MKIIRSVNKMQKIIKELKKKEKVISFVPTMGYLHEGHISLLRRAQKVADILILSIFVNPLQFGVNEDYKEYPRDIKKDAKIAKLLKVDYIFYPKTEEMYPQGYKSFVIVEELSSKLCGKSRPLHFKGVTTVVLKLFNIIKPDIVFLGQKDIQQAIIIKKMIEDLNLDVKIKVLPIVREKNGLALSSRNKYLSCEERKKASVLFKSLKLAKEFYKNGEKDAFRIISQMKKIISKIKEVKIDYISVVEQENLNKVKIIQKGNILALAIKIGQTRLIDNIIF